MTDQVNEAVAWVYEELAGVDGVWVERVTLGPLPPWETRNARPLYTHPARGVVSDAMVDLAMDADALEYGASIPASRVRRILEAAAFQAAQPAVPAVSDGEAVIDRNEDGEIVAVTRRGNEWVSLKVVADHTKQDQDSQPAVPSVPVSLRDALEEALRWSPKSFAGSDAIRRFQALAGDYVQRLIEEAATPKDQPAQGVEGEQ